MLLGSRSYCSPPVALTNIVRSFPIRSLLVDRGVWSLELHWLSFVARLWYRWKCVPNGPTYVTVNDASLDHVFSVCHKRPRPFSFGARTNCAFPTCHSSNSPYNVRGATKDAYCAVSFQLILSNIFTRDPQDRSPGFRCSICVCLGMGWGYILRISFRRMRWSHTCVIATMKWCINSDPRLSWSRNKFQTYPESSLKRSHAFRKWDSGQDFSGFCQVTLKTL